MKIVGRLVDSAENVELEIKNGQIYSIVPQPNIEPSRTWISRPLIDIQINGFGGYDLNAESTTADDVSQMVQSVHETGTGYLYPTIITGSSQRIAQAIAAIHQASQDRSIERAILGIHIEGPYISSIEGPRGAHPKRHVRPPNWDEFRRWQDIAHGKIKICTLAPEVEGALPFIEKLVASDVIVGIGHTNATTEQIQNAISVGAKLSTHLGNAAHGLIRRHPNYIWDQLADDSLFASLIVDGHHLPSNVVKSMIRVKGLRKTILISDAVHLAGMKPGRYKFTNHEVELTTDKCVKLYGTNYLAGSALTLIKGIENTVRFCQIELPQAVSLATQMPAELLSLKDKMGKIKVGQAANLLTFEWDELSQLISEPKLYLTN